MDNTSASCQGYLQEELNEYEENTHMTPGEKRALRRWVRSGHSVHDIPESRYICPCCLPPEYDFLDVYRLNKELDTATKGMRAEEKRAYVDEYFGYREPDEEEVRWEEARKNTPPMVRKGYIMLSRESFWLWMYLFREGLDEEATEFLKEHKDDEVPFEWEGSFPPSDFAE